MILSCMAFGAQAQVSDLTLLPPVFKLVSGEGETTIPCPQVGTTKTEISVTNNGTSDQSACLVLALYELGTNRLVDLDTDTQVIGASETVTLTAQLDIETLDGYECRYYVWGFYEQFNPLRDSKSGANSIRANRTATDQTHHSYLESQCGR